MQLRFASFAVANSREDFHLQDRAHAGRTTKKGKCIAHFPFILEREKSLELSTYTLARYRSTN